MFCYLSAVHVDGSNNNTTVRICHCINFMSCLDVFLWSSSLFLLTFCQAALAPLIISSVCLVATVGIQIV